MNALNKQQQPGPAKLKADSVWSSQVKRKAEDTAGPSAAWGQRGESPATSASAAKQPVRGSAVVPRARGRAAFSGQRCIRRV
jgi:hypothetical protein